MRVTDLDADSALRVATSRVKDDELKSAYDTKGVKKELKRSKS